MLYHEKIINTLNNVAGVYRWLSKHIDSKEYTAKCKAQYGTRC